MAELGTRKTIRQLITFILGIRESCNIHMGRLKTCDAIIEKIKEVFVGENY